MLPRSNVCEGATLIGATFEPALEDERSRTRFANWVAGRYNDELTAEEEAELACCLDGVLISEGGAIAATAPLFRTEKTISLHDYQSTTRLQLDHFTPEEDEPQQP